MFKNGIKAKVDQAHSQNLIVKKETGILDNLKKELKEVAAKRQDGLLNGTDVDAIVEDNVRGSLELLQAVELLFPGQNIPESSMAILQELSNYVTVSVTKLADRVGKTTIEEVVDYKVTKFGKIRFKKH